MVTNWWLSVGVTRGQLHDFQAEMMHPRLVRDDRTHPVYEDWPQKAPGLQRKLS
ncbi:hypothetical protein [Streptomyces sp. WM6378]|uniref:hypothetical protein n=1 Tax=Streptomyces sp. WM6378 TaxID=1415557 RepID=UPI000B1CBF58|nr:hypothetical protein [Streptomyces sp. WM6378]